MQGVVTGKSDKTVKVKVVRTVVHPKYWKIVKKSKSYLAHSESDVSLGDVVNIMSCKPISRKKRWVVYD